MFKHFFQTILLLATVVTAAFSQEPMKLHIIDIGQGSAALIEFPCAVMMIDTGGESNEEFTGVDSLMKYVDTFFAARPHLSNTIELLMISHPHKDHTLGVKSILSKYRVKNVVTNGQLTGSGKVGQIALHTAIATSEDTSSTADDIGFFESLYTNIQNGGTTSDIIDPINCPGSDPTIKILWGQLKSNSQGWSKGDFADQNNHSVVCRIDYGQSSILFTGDLEIAAIKSLLAKHTNKSIFDADVYIAGHHGSSNGTTDLFVKAISPEIAILSFGDPDRQLSWTAYAYGHPNKGILKILTDNIARTRTPKEVLVGDGAENFERMTISKAVYGVGWDGAMVFTGTFDGNWALQEKEGLININTATKEDLETLPTIGAVRAQAIIAYRTTHPFNTIEQLDNVPGIGAATISLLRPLVKI